MIKLIYGRKGSGKTKKMIEIINQSVNECKGQLICVEKNMKLTYTIDHSVRLIDVDDYAIRGYEEFYGFYCGLLASNYDIEKVFIDGILKIGGGMEGLDRLLFRINEINGDHIDTYVTVSADESEIPEEVMKYGSAD
ncbi:MAG: hypothetical protein ACOX6J_03050 [Oscillospiraceae bacterium]|jgi:hypothetical protein